MTDPIAFPSTTERFALPLLFPGQSQKEFFVNEAHSLIDALLHPSVEGLSATPPANATEGELWLVGVNAQGEWAGRDDQIALFLGASWLFVVPRRGMRIFDSALGRSRYFDGQWLDASSPSEPSGGTTVDTEARAAITEVINALQNHGIISQV